MKPALRSLVVVPLLAFALAVSACGSTEAGDDDDGQGRDGGRVQFDGGSWNWDGGTGGDGDIDQPPPEDCPDSAKVVYVVDEDMRFSSFDPRPTPPVFHDIGTLKCSAQMLATPFSMSVDRDAVAWVLYSSGQLFRVDTGTAACTGTSFAVGQQGFDLFGMGFVADNPGSTLDTLFIAGGAGPDSGSANLGTVDMTSLTVSTVGPVSGWPELTGTGDAKLWGFYPDTSPPKVAQIDKTSGGELTVFPLASLAGTPRAWAFAFWGGDFWIFYMRQDDNDTIVYHVKGTDGSMSVALPSTGRTIVGAGVSTCAPIVID